MTVIRPYELHASPDGPVVVVGHDSIVGQDLTPADYLLAVPIHAHAFPAASWVAVLDDGQRADASLLRRIPTRNLGSGVRYDWHGSPARPLSHDERRRVQIALASALGFGSSLDLQEMAVAVNRIGLT